jgi:hypothetical protein
MSDSQPHISIADAKEFMLQCLDESTAYKEVLLDLVNPATDNPPDHTFDTDFKKMVATGVFPSGTHWKVEIPIEDLLNQSGSVLDGLSAISAEFNHRLHTALLRDIMERLVHKGIGTLSQDGVYKCDPRIPIPHDTRDFFEKYGILVVD